MAKLSDLPLELVRHIASFLRPDWPGALLLYHDEGCEWVHDIRKVHNANRASLLNFSYTSKAYHLGLAPELVRSLGVLDRTGGNELRMLFKLLRYLLHNPASSPSAVRKLFIDLYSDKHTGRSSGLDHVCQRDMDLLKEAAVCFGINIWRETLAWNDDMGFETLFDFRPHASIYFCNYILDAPLPWVPNITSLVFRDVKGITLSTVCQLINDTQRLTKFICIQEVESENSPVLSPGSMFRALKKHGSSLKTLCLGVVFRYESFPDQTPPPYINSFKDFKVLEQMWINCSCFGDRYGVGSKVLRTIPTSLWRLHLAGSVDILEDDMLRWAEILSGKRFDEQDDERDDEAYDEGYDEAYDKEDDEEDNDAGDGEDDEKDMMEDMEEDDNDNDYVHIPEHLAWDIGLDNFDHEVHEAFRNSKWVDFFEAPSPLPGIF
ncbi:hypothetical protein CGCSCA4_v002114 [Colletotrichum siamense]|uniref:Uncharacterized protein n=1 Tax=Colletotrichum siamense TaxID=690259 RepID=A0A9P5F1K7_COLSI|nr:hypothetical protein CGCSCA4_v002114 [Colletotrichum siamense]KAF4863918.1 hypothetical protein CGCSCA2_v002249 [Colletotrichum siamense]